jgi:hypothetical protein
MAQWQSQTRMQIWDSNRENLDWNSFYNYLNYQCSPTQRQTNPKYSQLKAFKLKLLLEELPTLEVLHKRDNKKHPNPTCTRCFTTTESNYHLLTCSCNNTSLRKIITETVNKILTKYDVIDSKTKHQITMIITQSICLTDTQTELTRVTLGMLSKDNTRYINKVAKIPKPKKSLSIYLMHKIAQKIHKEIWITRCKEQYNIQNKPNTTKLQKTNENITTVSTNIANAHNTVLTELKTEIKLEIWKKLFVNYNTSPNYIDTIVD